MAGEWDGLVVVCGASWWGGTPLLEQHVAVQLTEYAPVLYVDPPTSLLTRFRSPQAADLASPPGLRRVHDRIQVLSVHVPPLMERPGVKQLSLMATRRAIRSAVRELGSSHVEALIVTTLDPLFGSAGERSRVLYLKDDYLAGAELTGIPSRRLSAMTRRLPQQADVIVAVSDVIAEGFRNRGVDTLTIPNGVNVETFAEAGIPRRETPLVAFVGHLSERVDVRFLEAVAARGITLRMVGPRQETMDAAHLDPLRGHASVEWTGTVPYDRLGSTLADVTTCLIPYGDTAFNRASFPLKILEYLAAGRRVVSTDLPAARWLQTDLVQLADRPEAFADAVELSLSTPLTSSEIDERRRFATGHSWRSRVETLAHRVGLTPEANRSTRSGRSGVPA